MAENKREYSEQSIYSLKNEETVRQRPAVIFGTNDERGAAHAIFEILANAIDEAREGYGKQIRMSVFKDGSVEISDDGRGVPMDWNEAEGKYNWELVFTTLYASGKYKSGSYQDSLGLNGLGATATQFASEYMDVYSTRNGKTYIMHFKKGRPVGQLQIVDPIREGTGTTIRFKPDPEVFINIKNKVLPPEYFINILTRQAMLLPGLEFVFYHDDLGKTINIKYDGGMPEFIDSICKKPLLKKTLYFEGSAEGTDDPDIDPTPYTVKMRLALNFSREENFFELYHNASHLFEGGVTVDAFKNAITKAFEDHAKEIGKLEKGDRFLYKDIELILVTVGDTNCPGNRTFFKNQTKGAINNPFIRDAYYNFVYNNIRYWLDNDRSGEDIIDEIIANKKAREEAEKVSRKVVQNLSKSVKGIGNKPKKFVDCTSKEVEKRELYIVEGDSALGSCKMARDSKFQAIMPLRGKILNCLKEDLTTILSNEVIVDLMRVLGCGIEAKSKYIQDLPRFDINKLDWGKIIICTDADIDGMQIRCLILAMIYRLVPTLLKAGKVYIVESPLYEIIYKGKSHFAYSDEERDKIVEELIKNGAKKGQIDINRSKGLGENNAEMMAKTTMSPKTRRLIPVEYPEDEETVARYFNILLGDDLEERKRIIDMYFETTEVDID
jgi:DNA gyrase subunit B